MDKETMDYWNTVDEVLKRKRPQDINSNNVENTVEDTSEFSHKETKDTDSDIKKESISDVDIVLLTAVEDEYRVALRVFKGIHAEIYTNGFKYALANCEIVNGKNIELAIFKQNNMGLVSAAMTATYAVNKFNPKMLLMCGVCAGVEGKANYGDLIVLSPVFDYGSGKYYSGKFLPDYRQHHISGVIRPIVEEMCCNIELKREIKDAWENQGGKPDTELNIYIYPGGSGSAVITDDSVVEEIKTHQRTLGAIDMESFAVAEVANAALTKEIPWLVVKGVQDFASPLKNDKYREYSAFVSAVFIKKFLEKVYSNTTRD